jgi:hypothetical protein
VTEARVVGKRGQVTPTCGIASEPDQVELVALVSTLVDLDDRETTTGYVGGTADRLG